MREEAAEGFGEFVAEGEVRLLVRADAVFLAEAGDFDDGKRHKS
jgi:hypothetical protein